MRQKPFIYLLTLIISTALACNLPFVGHVGSFLPDGMIEDYSPSAETELEDDFSYSIDQLAVLETYGSPTRFTILFGKRVRQETWFYDTAGYTVVFRDGLKISEQTVGPEYQEEMYATTYSPDQFYEGMEIDEIVLSTGQDDFMLTSFEGMDEDGRLMHMEGLSIGFYADEISFVETYPAMTEIKLEPEDFVPVILLTPEESANQGQHEYQIIYYLDGELFNQETSIVVITFIDQRTTVELEGEIHSFKPIDQNLYRSDDEQPVTMTFTEDGFVWEVDEEDYEIEVVFSLVE